MVSRWIGLVVAMAAAPAVAAVVQVDASPIFNADVVLNDGAGGLDPTQDPIDLGALASDNFCFPTASAAAGLAPFTPVSGGRLPSRGAPRVAQRR
jgi:hypothetical protein